MARSVDPQRLESGQFLSANPSYRHAAAKSGDPFDRTTWTAPSNCEITHDGYIRPLSKDGAEKRVYRPLVDTPDLFLEFARQPYEECSEEVVRDWVRKYGILGYGREGEYDYGTDTNPWEDEDLGSRGSVRGQKDEDSNQPTLWGFEQWDLDLYGSKSGPVDNVRTFYTEVELAATVLRTYEAILAADGKWAMERLFESRFHSPSDYVNSYEDEEGQIVEYGYYDEKSISNEAALSLALSAVAKHVDDKLRYCHPGLDWWYIAQHAKDHSDLKQHWRFDNLVGAMYLQMWWLMVSRADIVRCQNPMCGKIISLAPPQEGARKPRSDKKFCDDACRQQYRYHTKVKPARLEKDSRKDLEPG